MSETNRRPATNVIHAGQRPEPITGAVMPPIFLSSTYAQEGPGQHTGFEYTRSHNPTRYALERMAARLEGSTLTEAQDVTCGGFACASGLAAMSVVLELVDAGARVVAMDDIYGGSNRLLTQVRARSAGLKIEFANLADPAVVDSVFKTPADLVWVETPTNPMLKIVDLAHVGRAAKASSPGTILACDNTFATPMAQRPLEHGFDIAMHSTTKFMNGHSDCVGGLIVTGRADLAERLRFLQNAVGPVMSPFDSYLTLRGIKTLAIRMKTHTESSQRIAEHLEQHPAVERVIYPGLASHPQHELASRQMDLAGGIISFDIKGGLDEARRMLEAIEIFTLAESLGGVESLIEHPAIMTHASVPADMRAELGIGDAFIRVSVGIEDADDLIEALDQALHAAVPARV